MGKCRLSREQGGCLISFLSAKKCLPGEPSLRMHSRLFHAGEWDTSLRSFAGPPSNALACNRSAEASGEVLPIPSANGGKGK